jgi:phage antirepressor YoqD-like protein
MGKKKTHEEYVKELAIKNPAVEVVGRYVNTNTAILHHCLIHDVLWNTTPSRVLHGAGCEECRVEKFRQVRCKTHAQYMQEVKSVNPDIIVVGQYIDAHTPIEYYCIKHNITWFTYPDNILRGCGCKECGNEKSKEKKIKSHEKYMSDLYVTNPNIEVLEEYQGANVSILHRCKIDGYEWMARPGNILSGKGCPRCQEPHGEKHIRQWLYEHQIEYVSQKIFNDCRNQRPLPFDFYLPAYNLCIEYDGEQHFRVVELFGGQEGFEQRKQNDEIKNQYCRDNNIHLLRIPYFKNTQDELEKFFIHLI